MHETDVARTFISDSSLIVEAGRLVPFLIPQLRLGHRATLLPMQYETVHFIFRLAENQFSFGGSLHRKYSFLRAISFGYETAGNSGWRALTVKFV